MLRPSDVKPTTQQESSSNISPKAKTYRRYPRPQFHWYSQECSNHLEIGYFCSHFFIICSCFCSLLSPWWPRKFPHALQNTSMIEAKICVVGIRLQRKKNVRSLWATSQPKTYVHYRRKSI